MNNYQFRRIDSSVYEHIRTLYKRAFNRKPPIEFLINKYNTSFFGLQHTGYIAFDEKDSPAAYYGVFPIIMRVAGKDYLAAQSGDTMTDPCHQKKGLFTRLAKMSYDLAKEKNVQFVYGFPNKNSFHGLANKLDWKFYDYMYNFRFVTKTLPLCEVSYKFPFLENMYQSYVKFRVSKYSIPYGNLGKTTSFNDENSYGAVKKDLNFFRYKMQRNCFLLKMMNFTIFIKAEGHLLIGDVVPFRKERMGEFMEVIKKLSRLLGCHKTIFAVNKNHWLYSYLSEVADPVPRSPVGFFEINKDISYEKISFTLADFDTF
jgi:hypothetical protein